MRVSDYSMIAKAFQKMLFFDANRCLTATVGRGSQERKAQKELIVLEEEHGTLEETRTFRNIKSWPVLPALGICPSTSRLATPGDS